jgi:sugar (pentulose or hexulose) kinase
VIGVDVGSQSVKAVVADEEGTALATASAPCTMSHPAGAWAEQDPAIHPADEQRLLETHRALFDGVEGALA